MGRYTTVQVYSDQNTKVVAGYNETSGNTSAAVVQTGPLKVEKVNNVMGSCAGAGSGEFDVYRAARRRELNRLDDIEKKQKEEEERRLFEEKVLLNKAEALERTRKNAEKRLKKKLKKRKLEEVAVDEVRITTNDLSADVISKSVKLSEVNENT